MAAKELSINEQIKAPQIRLIGSDGSQLGILKTRDALNMAYEKNLDLVEISAQGNPPVCKIMDYGKFKFEKDKKDKESKKKQTVMEVKEIKLTCRIGQHDLDTKLAHAQKFLSAGNKVKMTVVFSGREMNHTDIGLKLLEQVAGLVQDFGTVDKKPNLEGRFMTMFVSPKTK
ncbi:MAG: translation initiation factor IF-3 [Clostridia bacterium]|nr:translation initiation factor IF-3 [Clostridia bacterium]